MTLDNGLLSDAGRLAALRAMNILDTPREPDFDAVVNFVSTVCDAPMCVINLIEEHRQWFKAETGLGVRELPLDVSICAHALLQPGLMEVPDLTQDDRFDCNPLVTGTPQLRFYAGALLMTDDGFALGTLCILDHRPRTLSELQRQTLLTLARQVMGQMQLRKIATQNAASVQELERARLEARRQEARQRAILNGAVDYAIVTTDHRGVVLQWSEGAARMLGWDASEMLGERIDRIFTHTDRIAHRAEVDMLATLESGSANDERLHLRKDGTTFWASSTTTLLKGDAGTVDGFVKVLRDRTAERQREQRFSMLARAASGLLSASDPDSVLGPILDQSKDLLGFEESYSYVLTPDCQHLHLTHAIGASEAVRATLVDASFDLPICGVVAQTLRPLILENLQQSTEPRYDVGRRCGYHAFAAFPIFAEGRLYGVMSFATRTRTAFDSESIEFFSTLSHYVSVVRARIAAENSLKDLALTLERRVDERTQALQRAEAALRQSQKMEAVGQLTGGIAHDFNNLLTGIGGSLELLQSRIQQQRYGEVDRYVHAAQGAAKRAAALTHRLLAFSRRQTLDPKPINVNRLVLGMEDLIRRTIGPSIEMAPLAAAGDLWTTFVDASQLENALLNLCINARDAMPDGGKLTIATDNRWLDEVSALEHDLPPGQYIALCVSDNGTGMTPDVVSQAFDPFFTTKPLGQGTGLGLSMIYGFARQSSGQVHIQSAIGEGTTVCLYLPRYLGDVEVQDGSSENAALSMANAGETVLVIDDEPTVRMLVAEVLRELGYQSLEAEDGPSGLDVLRSNARIDLLVTDVGLPGGMNGRQVADAARDLRPGLSVLFITGYAETAVLSHGHLVAGMHVLTKPFTMQALGDRIKDLIAQSRR